ncbi:UNC-like C-terminal-domain-containing protein [Massariosphaeria phaeospora]|uniref:UNC-like C-terminal-domain-containing protein n=1 Tax=Massariosphaeria phaeospora TaxID=100035 RepID=A0A7C8I8N1_9PLEO|nr:UNC-like C-terminal-domain-containing protein [Massariosphaeria phaeospora]
MSSLRAGGPLVKMESSLEASHSTPTTHTRIISHIEATRYTMARNNARTPSIAPSRRSNRLAGSVAESVAESVAASTATSRKGPLPKAKARQSHAYGAGGRVGAAEELAVPVTGFTQAFDAQRESAVVRDEDVNISGALNAGTTRGSPTPSNASRFASVTPHDDESVRPPSLSPLAPDTVSRTREMDSSKSFGMVHETGLLHERESTRMGLSQSNTVLQGRHSPSAFVGASGVASQTNDVPQGHPSPAMFPRAPGHGILKNLWAQVLFGLLISAVIVATLMGLRNYKTTSAGLPESSSITTVAVASKTRYLDDCYTPLSDDMYSMIRGLPEGRIGIDYDILSVRQFKAERKVEFMMNTLRKFQEDLPDMVIAHREKDGELTIPDEFWRAFASKMSLQPLVAGNDPNSDSEWTEFWEKNQARIKDMTPQLIEGETSFPTLIHREELTKLLEKQYTKTAELVDRKIDLAMQTMAVEVRAIARKEADGAVLDKLRLHSFALTMFVTNAELSLRNVNYFSTGLQAHIDPHHTSATMLDPLGILPKLARWILSIPHRRPPVVALEGWKEPGDCWCVAPDTVGMGMAQIAVNLGHTIRPTKITIDHLPKLAAPGKDITNAPQNMELWVMTDQEPNWLITKVKGSSCGIGPRGWVCLGQFRYNIHSSNHIQTFQLEGDIATGISKAMVRVVDNWGADHTCIYRIRLHGEEAMVEGDEE